MHTRYNAGHKLGLLCSKGVGIKGGMGNEETDDEEWKRGMEMEEWKLVQSNLSHPGSLGPRPRLPGSEKFHHSMPFML